MRKARDSRARGERVPWVPKAVYFIQKEEERNSLYVALTPAEKDVYGYNRGRQSSGRTVEMKLK